MKDLLILLAHLLTTIAKLMGPGGARTVVADSLLMKRQLLVINRSRRRAPDLSALDRFLFGFWSLFLQPNRIQRAAVINRPSALLKFHDLLKKHTPAAVLIQAIVELKQSNHALAALESRSKSTWHSAWILTRFWSDLSSPGTAVARRRNTSGYKW